jgi:anti-sigma B factor antagonist
MSGQGPAPGSLLISSVSADGTFSISLEGELDLASARKMEERLEAIDEEGPSRVIVDLGKLAFIDSTGLRVLLLADARARERGYELVLRPGEPSVQRVFEVTGALDVLRFEGS